jgi:hypothetical protein
MRTRSHLVALLALGLLQSGCMGAIGSGEADGGDGDDGSIDPQSRGTAPTDLRRLSLSELRGTMRDLFGEGALRAAELSLRAVPADRSAPGAFATLPYSTEARGVTSAHIDSQYEVFVDVAEYFRDNPNELAKLDPCLPVGASDSACVSGFIDRLGTRAYRRPLTSNEKAALESTYASGNTLSPVEGISLVILRMLTSPAFLYRLELEGTATATAEIHALDGYALASRLSYLAWGTMPDDKLLSRAGGDLLEEAAFDAEVEHLFDDPRATIRARAFFEEWLSLDFAPPIEMSTAFLNGIDGSVLASEVRDEFDAFVGGFYEMNGPYSDLLTSNDVSLSGDAIAAVYGVSRDATRLSDTERAGLITRAAFLLGPGASTHPIRRGAAIRRYFMCDTIAPPDPSKFPPNSIVPPPFDPNKSARERWTAQTSPENCASCHTYINAPGFVLEAFDPIGRHRDSEPILDPATGVEVNRLPINTEVDLTLFGDDTVTINGAVDLARQLAKSDDAMRCFAKQVFQYAEGRKPAQEDTGLLSDATALLGTEGIKSVLRTIALNPSFKLRKVNP